MNRSNPGAPARTLFPWGAVLALALTGCQAVQSYLGYRRVLAHEDHFAGLVVEGYDLDVELLPELSRLEVRVTIEIFNGGERRLDDLEWFVAPEADITSIRQGDQPVDFETEELRLGEYRMLAIRSGVAPIESSERTSVWFAYSLQFPRPSSEARLLPDEGYLRHESIWIPTIRTPLSERGRDKAPIRLRVRLPEGLTPVSLPTLTPASDGSTVFAGHSDFPTYPFLAYGRYDRVSDEAGRAEVYVPSKSDRRAGAEVVLEAALELRGRYEAMFGALPIETVRVVAVEGMPGGWGAPYTILVAQDRFPKPPEHGRDAYGLLAHELAHSWWGNWVGMHGWVGYLHEGLANYLSAVCIGARYGTQAEESVFEAYLRQYCDADEPLRVPLGELEITDWSTYERGAYTLGALFYRALDERVGRGQLITLLESFARQHGGSAADLDDLKRHLVDSGAPVEDVFAEWIDSADKAEELFEAVRALRAEGLAYWRGQTPDVDPALTAAVDAKLEEAVARIGAVDRELEPPAFVARARTALDTIEFERDVQVTVVDAAGNFVYHVAALTGSSLEYADVHDRSVYARILESEAPSGRFAYFNFLAYYGEGARATSLAWEWLPDLGWAVVVEGHEWRARELE